MSHGFVWVLDILFSVSYLEEKRKNLYIHISKNFLTSKSDKNNVEAATLAASEYLEEYVNLTSSFRENSKIWILHVACLFSRQF